MVPPDGEKLNKIFKDLADWEQQLRALEKGLEKSWEDPAP